MHPLKYVHFVSLQYYCSTSQKIPMADPQDLLPAAHAQPTGPPHRTKRAQSRRLGGDGEEAERQREKKNGHRLCDRGRKFAVIIHWVTADDEHPSPRIANVPRRIQIGGRRMEDGGRKMKEEG